MMSNKKLLILERSKSNLSMSKDADGSIVLEGVFTEIGVKNKNNRIYEEDEVLPHINELKEKVKTNKLLGELDHPKDFDISLSNVSHVIEHLEYDKEKKQVLGRIRLLNTSKGREAQALIQDGIPLHISSRAAGTVDENGKVKIKKFFTYDLVADPGFENAELARVNESYGFEDCEDLFIYEMDNSEDEEIYKTNKNKTNLTMENTAENFVTVGDFNKYTEYVKNILDSVKESTNSTNDYLIQKLVTYTEHIAEKVNQVTDYSEYLSEALDKSISYSDYLAENVDQIKKYSSYVGVELDKSIQYTEYVAEQADNGIEYSNYLAENLDKGIAYSNYLAENLDKGIAYSEYVAEKVDQNIAYSEYLGEGLDKSIKYSEYIAENANTIEGTLINEGRKTIDPSTFGDDKLTTAKKFLGINESAVINKSDSSYKDTISEKLELLISKAKTNSLTEMHFMKFLSESKRNEFDSLADSKKVLLVESMNSKPIMSTIQAENVWDSCFITKRTAIDFIENMPEKFRGKWDNLSETRQQQITAESKFHSLNTPYAISNFWQTRDLRSTQMSLVAINESKTAGETTQVKSKSLLTESFQADLIKQMKFRLGR